MVFVVFGLCRVFGAHQCGAASPASWRRTSPHLTSRLTLSKNFLDPPSHESRAAAHASHGVPALNRAPFLLPQTMSGVYHTVRRWVLAGSVVSITIAGTFIGATLGAERDAYTVCPPSTLSCEFSPLCWSILLC